MSCGPLFQEHKFSTADISQISFWRVTKFGTITGLANRHSFPQIWWTLAYFSIFENLWDRISRRVVLTACGRSQGNVVNFGLHSREYKFSAANISHTYCQSTTKTGMLWVWPI